MGTKRQHYVPKVYLKAWEGKVENSKHPGNIFEGVYIYEGDSPIGEGFSRDAVLWSPHIYTISFQDSYLVKKCSRVRKEFVSEVDRLMKEGFKKIVYAKCRYSIIKNKRSIEKHIDEIDNWDFYYEDGRLAGKKGILERINSINSYILEDSFSKVYEEHWEELLNKFVDAVHNGKPYQYGRSERVIDNEIAERVINFFFMMLCRNPAFDAMGIYTSIKKNIFNPVFGVEDDNTSYSDELMRVIWYHELYRMFFSKSAGFYNNVVAKSYGALQMILFEAYDNAGTFITSDNPAYEYKSCVELQNSNGLFFPLSPKYMLFIGRGDEGINVIDYRFANKDTVRKFNSMTKRNSCNRIVSIERELSSIL